MKWIAGRAHVDGEVFVGQKEESLDAVVETLEPRVGVDVEQSTSARHVQ